MTNPMVTEVNRLLANLLARGERVALPEVGSLIPVAQPSRRLSRRKLLPPSREIAFSSEVSGTTLAEQIAKATGCEMERAVEIYGRWLSHTWCDGELTIAEVGQLKMKHFTPTEAFDARLNPEGRTPITVQRRTDWMIWVAVVALLFAVGMAYVGYTELYRKQPISDTAQVVDRAADRPMKRPKSDTVATAAALAEVAKAIVDETEATYAQQYAKADAAKNNIAAQSPQSATSSSNEQRSTTTDPGVMTMTSGHYYVVLGVFSTPDNAERAVSRALDEDGTMRCGVYRFGAKWMVSPFDSDDREACDLFRRAHAATHPDMWIHKAK